MADTNDMRLFDDLTATDRPGGFKGKNLKDVFDELVYIGSYMSMTLNEWVGLTKINDDTVTHCEKDPNALIIPCKAVKEVIGKRSR